MPNDTQRPLSAIAEEIRADWPKMYFGAVPYVDAMAEMVVPGQDYGYDSADTIVRYFLSNAATWHGPKAREIKAELKGMLKQS